MTQPRDPRPTCPPEPLEITEEEYEAAYERFNSARFDYQVWEEEARNNPSERASEKLFWVESELRIAEREWQDAQRRAASDHQTRMRDDPAYRRSVRERDYLP